jgi:Domain of unknown function (DUF222)
MSATPASATPQEAWEAVRDGLARLAEADPAGMPDAVKADCLLELERAEAVITAVRAWVLGAFAAGQGYSADADYSAGAWLMHRTKVTRGAARGHVGWARRATAHPQVAAALAEGNVVSESVARELCRWTDRLPEDCRDAADAILVAAARAGAREEDLAGLFAEILARSGPDEPDEDGDGFDDREVRLETTMDGAGVMTGNLTPECAALVGAVLEALSAPAGPEDTRTRGQRCHDALEDAMRRLIAADLLPARAGQPTKAWVHVSLAELRAMDTDSVLQDQWVTAVQAKWAVGRAAASVGGGDGAAWLDGDAARAVTCDAVMIPVVTGDIDHGVLDDLVGLCLQLAGYGRGAAADGQGPADPAPDGTGPADGAAGTGPGAGALSPQAREMLERAIIGKAIDLLSGPGGLASFLRRGLLGARLSGPSLPLDIGYSDTIPGGIRNAALLRDRHCRWPGGCHQPAGACQVHHVRHRANGGETSLKDCVLLCPFHHLVVIHRWGWTLVLNPDGTTTAWDKDRTKVLHSHSPPTARAG